MPDSPPPDDNFLARRYVAALALVAALILMDQVIVQPPLYSLTTDAPLISYAARQRMLSEKLSRTALEWKHADKGDEAKRTRLLGELDKVLQQWSEAHNGLRYGDPSGVLPGWNTEGIRRALDHIDPLFRRIYEAASRLRRAEADPAASGRDLATILDNEGVYLEKMGEVVDLYEADSRTRVERLRRTGWLLTGLILLALVGIGLFILRPAARLIRRQVDELVHARDALEARVRERTGALEQANRDLLHEVKERALTEARHRALVEQFSHVARTNTIGEMATGLAHELNQPLGAVANYVEGCLVALDSPGPPIDQVKQALEKALGSTLRAGQIIQRIRRFVTRHPIEAESFAPNRVVEEVEALFRDEALRLRVALRLDLAPGLPWLSGDPIQVQQVLVNLVRNATEAVTSSPTRAPSVALKTCVDDRGDVEFRVTDNGEGIPPERIGHVFDPFFSTRAGGMGMGLAISRTIVEAHHGRLTVESRPGIETSFRFILPSAGAGDLDHGSDSVCGG